MPTTEHDCEVMERLLEAVQSGRVTSDEQWKALCRCVEATEGHVFAVLMTLGGRLPWER